MRIDEIVSGQQKKKKQTVVQQEEKGESVLAQVAKSLKGIKTDFQKGAQKGQAIFRALNYKM